MPMIKACMGSFSVQESYRYMHAYAFVYTSTYKNICIVIYIYTHTHTHTHTTYNTYPYLHLQRRGLDPLAVERRLRAPRCTAVQRVKLARRVRPVHRGVREMGRRARCGASRWQGRVGCDASAWRAHQVAHETASRSRRRSSTRRAMEPPRYHLTVEVHT